MPEASAGKILGVWEENREISIFEGDPTNLPKFGTTLKCLKCGAIDVDDEPFNE